MAEPTYEVKLKDGEGKIDAPETFSKEQIAELVDQKAQEKAEEISTAQVEKLKDELAQSLSGKKEDIPPASWKDQREETRNIANKIVEEKINERLNLERKLSEEKQKQNTKQVEEAQKAEYARMSTEWAEAVQDGVLPDISKEVKAKLKSGVKYEELTEDEQKDAGLKAYNEARLLHIQMKNEGKSNSFYRTASQFYRKQPAGARAPVFGGGVASPGSSSGDSDYTYEDIKKNRKARYGI